MRATDFEFRHRFWIIFLLFWAAFGAYFVDHQSAGVAVAKLFLSGEKLDSPVGLRTLHAVFLAAALLVGIAALLRSWASAYLRSELVHDPNLRTEGVVADGPYRHLRNPLYLGNLLLAAGMGLLASRLGFLILLAGHAFFLLRLIGREEAELAASQGQSYLAYRAAVPRLWPSLRPRVPAGGVEPRWLQGFVGETFMWILFAGSLYFAVTLNGRAMPYLVIAGVASYFLICKIQKRRRAAEQISSRA
jgi:protein-S-isoprenylcysteine O-methyltransferase Ste14